MNLPANDRLTLSSELQENIQILRQISYFADFPLETLKVCAYLCSRETFQAGEYLFRQHEDDGQAFYVISGKGCIEYQNDDNHWTLTDVESEAFIGGLALLGNRPRLFSLKALTDMVCLVFQRNTFVRMMEQFPDLMPKMIEAAVDNIHNWEERFFSENMKTCGKCMRNFGISLL